MAVFMEPTEAREAPTPSPRVGGPPGTITAPSPAATGTTSTGGPAALTPGLVPLLTAPKGRSTIIRDGPVSYRLILRPFEGLNVQQGITEIGDLQAVTMQNIITDEGLLTKRLGSVNVGAQAPGSIVGQAEVSSVRTLTLQACDDSTQWTTSSVPNFPVATETTIKVEGTASLRMNPVGAAADGATATHDLGAGNVKDLTQYDRVEVMLRASIGADTIRFGVSEDNVTYTEVAASAGSDTFRTLVLDISGMVSTTRDAIRYLRFRYANASGTARTIYADSITAKRAASSLLRCVYNGTVSPTGGSRDLSPTTNATQFETNRTGSWVVVSNEQPQLHLSDKMRAVSWLGQLFLMLGPGGAFRFQEGTFGAGVDAAELKTWPEAPPSRFLALHYEKLFAWDQTFDRNALRHTDTSSHISWPTGTNPAARGDGGLMYVGRQSGFLPAGMLSGYGQLFLWTEGDLWILFGSDNGNFTLTQAHPGCGALSNESIVNTGTSIIWHDGRQNRILQWSGGNVDDLSDPIKPILRAIPAGMKPWTAALWTGRFYILSYAVAAGTMNSQCVVWDTLTNRWHGPWDGHWASFVTALVGSDGSYQVGANFTSTLAGSIQALTGTTDAVINGASTGPVFKWKSGDLSVHLPRWTKRIRRFWMRVENTSSAFTVRFYLEGSASAVRTYTLTGTGAPFEYLSTGIDHNVRGAIIQCEIEETTVSGAVKVAEIGFDGFLLRALRF